MCKPHQSNEEIKYNKNSVYVACIIYCNGPVFQSATINNKICRTFVPQTLVEIKNKASHVKLKIKFIQPEIFFINRNA